jgi:hypothetical protein
MLFRFSNVTKKHVSKKNKYVTIEISFGSLIWNHQTTAAQEHL